jgi:hypothetical protein
MTKTVKQEQQWAIEQYGNPESIQHLSLTWWLKTMALLIPDKQSTMSWHIWESTMSWHLSSSQ